MDDTGDFDIRLGETIHNEIRGADNGQVAQLFAASGTAQTRISRKVLGLRTNGADKFGRRAWIVFGDVVPNILKVGDRLGRPDNEHNALRRPYAFRAFSWRCEHTLGASPLRAGYLYLRRARECQH